PAPSGNVLGGQTQGFPPHAMILPYIEQANVFNAANIHLSVIDPRNWPPNWAAKFGQAGNPAASTAIQIYMCPSTPAQVIDYQPYFTQQLGGLNAGPFTLGATDYAAIRGFTGTFRNNCATTSPAPPGGGDDGGALGRRGSMTPS